MKRNLIFKLLFYILGMVITIAAVPIIIGQLGVEEFGLISLLNSLLAYLSVVTIALTSSLGRNLIFSYKNSVLESSKELSTVVFSVLVLGCILLPFFFYFSKSLLVIIGVEPSYIREASFIIKVMSALFIINAISNSIGATFFLKNRLDLLSVTGFISQVSTHLIFLLFLLFTSMGLVSYSYAMALTSFILFVFTYVMYLKGFSEIAIKVSNFSIAKVKDNFALSFWLIINQVGVLILFQFSVLIIQLYEGLNTVAYFAISLVIANQIRAIANLISSLIEPNLIKHVANKNIAESNNLFEKAVFVISLLSGVLCGVYIGAAEEILQLWLGKYDPIIKNISIFSVSYLPLILGFSCSWPILIAHNKMKQGAIITFISAGIFITLSIVLFEFSALGVYSVLLATLIVMILKNNILTPILLKGLGMKVGRALINASYGLIYMCITVIVTKVIFSPLANIGIVGVLIGGVLSTVVALLLLLLVVGLYTDVSMSEIYKQPKLSILAMINRV